MGAGPTAVEAITTPAEWGEKAAALREIFRQDTRRATARGCPLDLRVEEVIDRGDHVERRYSYQVAPDERVARAGADSERALGAAPAVLCIHSTTPGASSKSSDAAATSATPWLLTAPMPSISSGADT